MAGATAAAAAHSSVQLQLLQQLQGAGHRRCGIGMSAIVDPAVGDLVIRSLAARGMKAWIAGVVEPASDLQAPRSYLTSAYKG